MSEEPLVLLVEDEPQMRRFLRTTLPPQGYRLVEATSGQDALRLCASQLPGLVLLDLGLPDLDGVEVARNLRVWSKVPIIVLSARDQERQKVQALDAGADDYLTKPFGFAELLARIRANLRRAERATSAESIQVGALSIDLANRAVTVAGTEVHLSPIEYKLLVTLARHPGRVVTHKHLLDEVWGPRAGQQNHYLRVYMTHLRRKLEDGGSARLFSTETGVGYRLLVEE